MTSSHRCPWSRILGVLCALGLTPCAVRGEEKPLRQVIDAEVRAAWKRQKLTPARAADDATFLRRVYLDLVGTIPTYEEAKRFLADTDASKRSKLIERLLADPRFSAQQAVVWDLVLFGRNPPNLEGSRARGGFRKWMNKKFADNVPADRWVRDLLLAEQEGTELFYAQFRGHPEDAAVGVSRIFLGTQLQCARCHDHPFETWTQRDFYGFAAFFARLVVLDRPRVKGQPRYALAEKRTGEVLFSGAAKDQRPGRRGEAIRAKFLGGAALEEPAVPKGFKEPPLRNSGTPPRPAFSRKEKLAAWVVAADNPYFSRALANRLWGQFFGRGLVHPVDDLTGKKPPSHPALLKALTAALKAHKYDLKWFIRELVSSAAYQVGAMGKGTDALPRWYERARVRPLVAEELLAAMRTATGFDAGGAKVSGGTDHYFLHYFGAPTNGRGEFQGGLAEHLFLNNSDQVRQFTHRRKGNLADVLVTSKEPWEKRVERLFLSVLSRRPSAAERKKFVAHLTSGKRSEERVQEAIWVLLNCAEFRFNR
jgi:hypothetical protein